MKNKNKSFEKAVAVGSALAGAALGAAAIILSDKKNQEKIKKTIGEISHDAVEIGKNMKKKTDEFTKNTNKSKKKTEKTVKRVVKKTVVKKSTPRTKTKE